MDRNTNQPPEPDTNYKPQPQPSEGQSAPQSQPQTAPGSGGKTSVLAILALVFGIIIPIVGIILGIIALVKIKKDPNLKGKGLAIAGLVIGIVLMIVGIIQVMSLLYFGVMNPDTLMPTRCVIEPGFDCTDYTAVGNTVSVSLFNNKGQDLEGVSLTIENACTPSAVSWPNGAYLEFTCAVSQRTEGQKQTYDMELKYTPSDGSYENTATGSLMI